MASAVVVTVAMNNGGWWRQWWCRAGGGCGWRVVKVVVVEMTGGFGETASKTTQSSSFSNNNNNNGDGGNFDCSICLDLAQDPIVTLCGHLFCWPCIYQWLNFHSHSNECPLCKAFIQEENLIPLYGKREELIRFASKPIHAATFQTVRLVRDQNQGCHRIRVSLCNMGLDS
ncbi:hypothetical protein E3N88_42359 [Mikania micrantha]|uniref:E3 ubiquitin-protein ligase RMA n=1 Tax=Mikania micrantha TaxID=192012 RepID=A0A5N6LI12_9ASTR|nr:hypothetical protein E3N88_42359 [Mikania micrantha]